MDECKPLPPTPFPPGSLHETSACNVHSNRVISSSRNPLHDTNCSTGNNCCCDTCSVNSRHAVGSLNSVSGLVSKTWYRIPFNQSELSVAKIPPIDSPMVRLCYHP